MDILNIKDMQYSCIYKICYIAEYTKYFKNIIAK